ncbi:20087_t:CDS:2, partial [Racocetra persica]
YESKEFLLKLCIKNQDNTTLPAKRLNILADSCSEFHYQILSHIQYQLNDTTITQNDYILSYKVTKETGSGTQIINESDFKSFLEDYNQATNRKKEVFINIQMWQSLKSNAKKQLHRSRSEEPNSDDNLNKKKPQTSSKPVPQLDEFLIKIDEANNANGEILACLSKFQNQAIQVKQISKLTDEQLELVGITKAG